MNFLKRVIFTAILVSLILTCGCKSNTLYPITSGFICNAETFYNGEQLNCSLKVKDSGEFCATVIANDKLNGLKYIWNGKSFTVNYKDLNLNFEQNNIAETSPVFILKEIIYKTELKNLPVKNGAVTGTESFGNFKVFVRPDGFIKKIEIPSLSFYANFKNLQYLF